MELIEKINTITGLNSKSSRFTLEKFQGISFELEAQKNILSNMQMEVVIDFVKTIRTHFKDHTFFNTKNTNEEAFNTHKFAKFSYQKLTVYGFTSLIDEYKKSRVMSEVYLDEWDKKFNIRNNDIFKQDVDEYNKVLNLIESKIELIEKLRHFYIPFSKQLEHIMNSKHMDLDDREFYKRKIDGIIKENIQLFNLSMSKQLHTFLNFEDGVINDLNVIMDSIKSKLISSDPTILKNLAEQYGDSVKQDKTIENILLKKQFDESIQFKIEYSLSQKINQIIMFKDESIGYISAGQYKTVNNYDDISFLDKNNKTSAINFILRKKPKIASLFVNKLLEDNETFSKCFSAMKTYLEHEDILKNEAFDISSLSNISFEAMDDTMNACVRSHKIKQLGNSILSNKYKHLNTPSMYEHFEVLYDAGISKSTLQEFIGKKLAAIDTSEKFEEFLKNTIKQFDQFTPKNLKIRLDNFNITPVFEKDGVVAFQVKDYESCKATGSSSWCIVRDKVYFDSYTSSESKQYIIYDFNKESKDIDSMIGFTLNKQGEFDTQHLKNDDYVKVSQLMKNIRLQIIKDFQIDFDLSDELKDLLKENVGPQPKQKSTL